jgi:hypothetical protein
VLFVHAATVALFGFVYASGKKLMPLFAHTLAPPPAQLVSNIARP